MMEPSEILEKAAEVLQAKGWQTGDLGTQKTGYCMLGAIRYASGHHHLQDFDKILRVVSEDLNWRLKNKINELYPHPYYVTWSQVWGFNDSQDTVEPVIDVLIQTAKGYRNEGR